VRPHWRSLEQLAGDVRALIVTRGGEGSEIYADGRRYDIPCVEADQISIRPAAAMPTVPACSTASPMV
jgi:hypothetical protein